MMTLRLIKLSRFAALAVAIVVPLGVWQQSELATWLTGALGGTPAVVVRLMAWPVLIGVVLFLLRLSTPMTRTAWVVSLGILLLIVSDASGVAGVWTRFLSEDIRRNLGEPQELLLLAGLIAELIAGIAYLVLSLSANWDDILRQREAEHADRLAAITGSTRFSLAALLLAGIFALLAGLAAGLASGTLNLGSVTAGILLITGTALIGLGLAVLVQTSVTRNSDSQT